MPTLHRELMAQIGYPLHEMLSFLTLEGRKCWKMLQVSSQHSWCHNSPDVSWSKSQVSQDFSGVNHSSNRNPSSLVFRNSAPCDLKLWPLFDSGMYVCILYIYTQNLQKKRWGSGYIYIHIYIHVYIHIYIRRCVVWCIPNFYGPFLKGLDDERGQPSSTAPPIATSLPRIAWPSATGRHPPGWFSTPKQTRDCSSFTNNNGGLMVFIEPTKMVI